MILLILFFSVLAIGAYRAARKEGTSHAELIALGAIALLIGGALVVAFESIQ